MGHAGDRTGQLLGGKYRLEALLARGGMGLVYAGRHRETGRAVAIKLLRPELVTQSDLVRRVSAEARLAVEATHPNVVEVLDAGADEAAVPYLVLERLYGRTLEALLGEPLPAFATLQVLVPVINALAALHDAGIVHRDIKPSNVFLSRERDGRLTPKLLDFGIAKALQHGSATSSGMALGTPAYMAPEQALGYHAVGPATDVWSMGVLLVRCLSGKLPFEGGAAGRMGALREGLRVEDLPQIAAPLAEVLVNALKLEPAERHAGMAAFRAELIRAARRLDPKLNWPDETTVSYAPGESHVSAWLDADPEPVVAAAEQPGASLRHRPDDVHTRTLSGLQSAAAGTPARMPRRRAWGLALVASLVAAAALALGPRSHDDVDTQTPEALPASAVVPAASGITAPAVAAPGANEAALRTPPPAPAPVPHSGAAPRTPVLPAPARSPSTNAAPNPSGSRPKADSETSPKAGARQVASPAPAEVRPTPSSPAKALTVGANRSPIIE